MDGRVVIASVHRNQRPVRTCVGKGVRLQGVQCTPISLVFCRCEGHTETRDIALCILE